MRLTEEREGMIWRGKHPVTVGEVDHEGNVVESFTVHPGQIIPLKWIKIIDKTRPEDILQVNDNGHYDPALVKKRFIEEEAEEEMRRGGGARE